MLRIELKFRVAIDNAFGIFPFGNFISSIFRLDLGWDKRFVSCAHHAALLKLIYRMCSLLAVVKAHRLSDQAGT